MGLITYQVPSYVTIIILFQGNAQAEFVSMAGDAKTTRRSSVSAAGVSAANDAKTVGTFAIDL